MPVTCLYRRRTANYKILTCLYCKRTSKQKILNNAVFSQVDQPSAKLAPKFSALPPPGHNQWDNIAGNENGTPVRGSPGPQHRAEAEKKSIPPLMQEPMAYRMAATSISQGPGGRGSEPTVSEDWYSEGGSSLGPAAPIPPVHQPKQLLGAFETDFTKVEKKKSTWSLTPFEK